MADDTHEIDGLELIYDWNLVDKASSEKMRVEFDDETLRPASGWGGRFLRSSRTLIE